MDSKVPSVKELAKNTLYEIAMLSDEPNYAPSQEHSRYLRNYILAVLGTEDVDYLFAERKLVLECLDALMKYHVSEKEMPEWKHMRYSIIKMTDENNG